MDEIEYKLNSNNSVLVVNAIDKLISAIKEKFKPAERQRFLLENEELKLLREKCSSREAVVSLTACQGLLALVELGVLEIAHTMSTIVTLLPTAHNYSAIISTMAGLLILDLKYRHVPGTVYKCQFSLKSPKHPFITVLERNKDAEGDVLAQMEAICNNTDFIVSSNSLELLRSVFLYLTCNPQREGSLRPWRLLLSLPATPQQRSLLLACLSCQQICSPAGVERAFGAYSAVADAAIFRQDEEYMLALIPMLARLSNELVKHGRDPRPCYVLIERGFGVDYGALKPAAGVTLLLLAENLPTAPASHLYATLDLGWTIINKYPIPSLSLNSFVAEVLQWLHLPSYLTTAALTVGSNIVDLYKKGDKTDNSLNIPNLISNKIFESLLYTESHLSVTVKLFSVWEKLRDNPNKLLLWLEGIDTIDNAVKLELLTFFNGLMMEKRKDFESVVLRVFKIVEGLVEYRKEVAVSLLPILIYKIAKESSPQMNLKCLKTLPLMAKLKENVPMIVLILNKLKNKKGVPTSFLIPMYLTLAETQVRCFPYLQELLVDTGEGRPDNLKWETEIARISAVKRMCEIRAPSHGLQLVPIVSSTLNRCTGAPGAFASSVAIQCIALLWRSGALSPHSAWRALEPKLQTDSRITVNKSVCKLLSELPALANSSPEYTSLASSACNLLWRHVSEGAPSLVLAACEALAKFPLTSYTLKDVPEIYRKTVKLPASYCKTPSDAARKPEDVLDYVPCEIWAEVFKYTKQEALPGVVKLASALLEREVREYRSGVYLLQGLEPATLGHLPPHSVVRGLTDAFRKQATAPSYEWPDEATLSILEAISSELSKPLPPMDMHFLPEVIARGGPWKPGAVSLAARCSKVSPSARSVVENWVHGLQNGNFEESDIILFYTLLPTLTRSIPPNSLRIPLERTLAEAFAPISKIKAKTPYEKTLLTRKSTIAKSGKTIVESANKSEDSGKKSVDSGKLEAGNEDYLFIRMLQLIKECLDCENIHDANRTLISQLMEHYFTVIDGDNVSWPYFVEMSTSLSSLHVERMSSPSSWWEADPKGLRRAGAVRGRIAPYALTEIIDAQTDNVNEQEYSLHYLFAALRDAPTDSEATKKWFLQLLARTQVAFNEMESKSSKLYLYTVFTLAVTTLSGHWALEADLEPLLKINDSGTYPLLPAAMASLLSKDSWQACTLKVLEWLWHTRDSFDGEDIAGYCQKTLLSLRHTEAFAKHKIWIRLENHFGKDIIAE